MTSARARILPRASAGSRAARRAKPGKTAYHVVCARDARRWRVLRGGKSAACLAEEPTQAQAVYRASVLAQANMPSRLLIHGPNGFVEALRDYA
jgi:hypothetical protein